MITLTILLTALIVLAIAAAIILLAGGAGVVIAFGDLIVCALIIWALVRLFKRRK